MLACQALNILLQNRRIYRAIKSMPERVEVGETEMPDD